jgi:hypothetical protein
MNLESLSIEDPDSDKDNWRMYQGLFLKNGVGVAACSLREPHWSSSASYSNSLEAGLTYSRRVEPHAMWRGAVKD